ncbi:MAG: GldG family protein [Oscillospiraceae bacterium]|jgi:ABC-2 type transport system permease protein|nr:GldG family protein [Oscillospiraceae bacterium]
MEKKKSRRGVYTAAISAAAVAVMLILNILLAQLPSGTLELDLSSGKTYQVSAASKAFLKTLERDVELVILSGKDETDVRLARFFARYERLSPRVSVRWIDPALDPNAADAYGAQTGNVVVLCADTGKSEVIPLIGFDGLDPGIVLYDYSAYYQAGQMRAVSFDAEGQLARAINLVSGEASETVYQLAGHSETPLPSGVTDLIGKANIGLAAVNLLQAGGVPEDCALLLCHAPANDLSEDELELLRAYLQDGGKLLLVLDAAELTRFNALLETYGLEILPGYAGDMERYYKQYDSYYIIYPVLSAESGVTSGLSADALVVEARGMLQVTPLRRAAVVTPFMTTSAQGFVYESGDEPPAGEYILGAVASETLSDGGKTSSLTVLSALSLIDDSVTSFVPGSANLDIFMNALTADLDGAALVTIPAKSLSIQYNALQDTGVWSVFFIGLVPAGFIICGLSVWLRRRAR